MKSTCLKIRACQILFEPFSISFPPILKTSRYVVLPNFLNSNKFLVYILKFSPNSNPPINKPWCFDAVIIVVIIRRPQEDCGLEVSESDPVLVNLQNFY